jgi:hypothetical protein
MSTPDPVRQRFLQQARAKARQRGHKLPRFTKSGGVLVAVCTVCGCRLLCQPTYLEMSGLALKVHCRPQEVLRPRQFS